MRLFSGRARPTGAAQVVDARLDRRLASVVPFVAGPSSADGLWRGLSRVVTSYLLAETIMMALIGQFGDVIGRKRAFLGGRHRRGRPRSSAAVVDTSAASSVLSMIAATTVSGASRLVTSRTLVLVRAACGLSHPMMWVGAVTCITSAVANRAHERPGCSHYAGEDRSVKCGEGGQRVSAAPG
ncbi:hypothetical protein [Amycolatopsis thermophila]|uniref:MFS family permease n=1 Tax=Amycolatopsis thermophila TaxID=206084 RepID=A0ABU0EQV4_9PSEU|nr:hypothetical protein [Amycolatopsis thermophila]MDQ0377674.1 MFS family permease [Amycolatopsis thermophila]